VSVEINGYCDEKFSKVRDVLKNSIESGGDIGASVSITLEGETVIDLWAGHKDEARVEAW
jgi:hypothetical protein